MKRDSGWLGSLADAECSQGEFNLIPAAWEHMHNKNCEITCHLQWICVRSQSIRPVPGGLTFSGRLHTEGREGYWSIIQDRRIWNVMLSCLTKQMALNVERARLIVTRFECLFSQKWHAPCHLSDGAGDVGSRHITLLARFP